MADTPSIYRVVLSSNIVIDNNPGAFMIDVDPNMELAREFSEYSNIVSAHLLDEESEVEVLFIGQQFDNNKDCLHAINQSLYVGECWKASSDCNWCVQAALMQRTQTYTIRKIEGSHTCMAALKDSSTIPISALIMDTQARLKYKVSYSKACETWLYELYIQILLITVVQDGNRNVLPIAFLIMGSENFESWEFFLSNLWRHVFRQDNIYLISDKSKGLVTAVRHSKIL
ncbi:hypothetical protein J1N35_010355 [Gossypium stocksii]|uniref:MULE transposase domain-containing protein n=1 Tax=Gossypium stocksii TaxID=47602 RepID=A0A9D4AAG3_9ROSI|nr:hypothetical protein J1N35_010355 [Gossypium stocksii]